MEMEVLFEDGTSNATKEFFRDCLPLNEKIQEISRAIKWIIDMKHKRDVSDRFLEDGTEAVPIKDAASESKPVCRQAFMRQFGLGLTSKSILCFQALRPLDPRLLDYMDNRSDEIHGEEYRLGFICLFGKKKLEDFEKVLASHPHQVASDLTTSVSGFQLFIVTFLVLFFPLIVSNTVPWSADNAKVSHQSINVILEEAKQILYEEEQDEEEDEANEFGVVDDSPLEMIDRRLERCKNVRTTVAVEKNDMVEGLITVLKKKKNIVQWKLENWCKLLFLSRDQVAQRIEWQWNIKNRISHSIDVMTKMNGKCSGDLDTNGGNSSKFCNRICDVNGSSGMKEKFEREQVKKKYNYVVLDSSTPRILGLRSLIAGRVGKNCKPAGRATLMILRRFIYTIFASGNAIILMAILDKTYFKDRIDRFMMFRNKHNVGISNLKYWNYLTNNEMKFSNKVMNWDFFYVLVACFWTLSVLILCFPGVSWYFTESLYPSEYLGFFKINMKKSDLTGMKRLYFGLTSRLAMPFYRTFWCTLRDKALERNPLTKKLSVRQIIRGFCSLTCVLSIVPIIAIFPPLYTWNKRYWPRAGLYFILSLATIITCISIIITTLYTYSYFIIFTTTSLLLQYQITVGYVSIIVGCIGFMGSMRSNIKNSYLGDKLFMLDIISEVHQAKILENEEQRNRILRHNEINPCQRIHVPELMWWWTRENWFCIPKLLYNDIVSKIRPVGRVRVKILVKISFLIIFISFIFTVMDALGMNDSQDAFDAVRMFITVLAVIVPTLIARLQCTQLDSINRIQRRGIVKEATERFLRKNEVFYHYDFVNVPDESEALEKNLRVSEQKYHMGADGILSKPKVTMCSYDQLKTVLHPYQV